MSCVERLAANRCSNDKPCMSSKILIIISVFILSRISFSQQDSILKISPFDVKIGFGIGNKSHYGNFGFSTNIFFTKNLSLKLSTGTGGFNYGGIVGSIGCEIPFLYLKKSYLSIGGTWTYIGEGFDLLGDDESKDYVSYNTSYMKNLKIYCGYSLLLDNLTLLTFEAGYSHALIPYHYTFGGPGLASQKQHDNIRQGLKSGWMASVYVNFIWSKRK